MIRIAIVVCCAALVAAEADPAVVYRSFGHGGLEHGYNTYRLPTAQMATGYYGYPAYEYSGPATVGSYKPYGYAASGRYLADSVGAVHLAKREAEAEPEGQEGQMVEPARFYNSYGAQALYNPAYNRAYNPIYNTAYNSFPSVYSRSFYQPSYNNFGYKSFYGKREAEADRHEPLVTPAEADVVYRHENLVTPTELKPVQHSGLYNTPYNTAYNTAYKTAYNTYTAGYPALRSFVPSVATSYPGYSVRPSIYSTTGYRNFVQPSYFGGYTPSVRPSTPPPGTGTS